MKYNPQSNKLMDYIDIGKDSFSNGFAINSVGNFMLNYNSFSWMKKEDHKLSIINTEYEMFKNDLGLHVYNTISDGKDFVASSLVDSNLDGFIRKYNSTGKLLWSVKAGDENSQIYNVSDGYWVNSELNYEMVYDSSTSDFVKISKDGRIISACNVLDKVTDDTVDKFILGCSGDQFLIIPVKTETRQVYNEEDGYVDTDFYLTTGDLVVLDKDFNIVKTKKIEKGLESEHIFTGKNGSFIYQGTKKNKKSNREFVKIIDRNGNITKSSSITSKSGKLDIKDAAMTDSGEIIATGTVFNKAFGTGDFKGVKHSGNICDGFVVKFKK